jgi:hypothetical protein
MVKMPNNVLIQALAPWELMAPSDELFLASWYRDGPTNPRFPNQGDELMTEEGGAILGQEERVKVPYLQYLPAA